MIERDEWTLKDTPTYRSRSVTEYSREVDENGDSVPYTDEPLPSELCTCAALCVGMTKLETKNFNPDCPAHSEECRGCIGSGVSRTDNGKHRLCERCHGLGRAMRREAAISLAINQHAQTKAALYTMTAERDQLRELLRVANNYVAVHDSDTARKLHIKISKSIQ